MKSDDQWQLLVDGKMYDLDIRKLSGHEKKVLQALADFIAQQHPQASLSAIDDIVLSYVVGVLEDVGHEDEFDDESFVEMIGAYVPGFESVDTALVCEWVFNLARLLEENGDEQDPSNIQAVNSNSVGVHTSNKVPLPDKITTLNQVKLTEGSSNQYSKTVNQESFKSQSPGSSGHHDPESTHEVCGHSQIPKAGPNDESPNEDKFGTINDECSNCMDLRSKANVISCKSLDPGTSTKSSRTKRSRRSRGKLEDSKLERDSSTEESQSCKNDKLCKSEAESSNADVDPYYVISEVIPGADLSQVRRCLEACGEDLEQAVQMLMDEMAIAERRQPKPEHEVPVTVKIKCSQQKREKRRKSSKENRSKITATKEPNKNNDKHCKTGDGDQFKEILHSEEDEEQERLLLELFPAASPVNVRQCLSIANGNPDVAVQLLMEKMDSGDLDPKPDSIGFRISSKVDERTQREMLLQKYGFVDQAEDSREHRPFVPKQNKKKLVRYINSRPVTMKGERFIEVKDKG